MLQEARSVFVTPENLALLVKHAGQAVSMAKLISSNLNTPSALLDTLNRISGLEAIVGKINIDYNFAALYHILKLSLAKTVSVIDLMKIMSHLSTTDISNLINYTDTKIKTYSDFLEAYILSLSSLFASFLAEMHTIAQCYKSIPKKALNNIPCAVDYESAMNDDLIKQAVTLFSNTQSIAQTAWRAYEPTAACVRWPNLLTQPSGANANDKVFTTSTSVANTTLEGQSVTLANASEDIRVIAAQIFLEIQNESLSEEVRKDLEQSFVSYIAEIRRTHNIRPNELDNPSCYPGCIPRLRQILNSHPKFKKVENQDDIPIMVLHAVLAKAQQELANFSSEPPEKMRLLLSAICLYGPLSVEQLAAGYDDGLEYNRSFAFSNELL